MAEPKRLTAGKEFEKLVLQDFISNSTDTEVESNRTIELNIENSRKKRKGRPDIIVLDSDRVIAIFEVKATNWDLIKTKNIKKNLWRHQRQISKYVEKFVADTSENVTLGLIYPKSPSNVALKHTIDMYLLQYGVPAYWFDELLQ